jgi:cardiolipin synthase
MSEEAVGTPWQDGNALVTLPNGDAFFARMLNEIRAARRSITLETFAFVNAPVTRRYSRALAERAREGVEVKLILDAVGSRDAGKKNLQLMREAGVDVRLYHPMNIFRPWSSNNRTHRKILVIDGRVAFTGGAGFAKAWGGDARNREEWRDTQYEIRGPAVAKFQGAFRENWFELTGEVLRGSSYFPDLASAGSAKVQVVADDPWNEIAPIADGYVAAINGAQGRLVLQQSYFVPNRRLRDLLLQAAGRGVAIEVMVPDEGIDSRATRQASQNHWEELLKGGIRIFQYERSMMHGKLLVADGLLSIVGSANLDDRSLFINDEINLHVESVAFAREQLLMYERDKKLSREVTMTNLKSVMEPWYQRFFAGLIESQL